MNIKRKARGDGTLGPWYVSTVNNTHHHRIADHERLLAAKITGEEAQEIFHNRMAGVGMATLRELLQGKHKGFLTADAVANAFYAAKKQYVGDRTDAQVLIDQLEEAEIPYKVCRDAHT